jgi:succinate dehydrogenase/fumarate reductase flavoprotein subunit
MEEHMAESADAADHTTVEVDTLVIGAGAGMAAALAAAELGLDVLVVEKTAYVGGSTARSGGAFWVPGNDALRRGGSTDSVAAAHDYVESVVGPDAPRARWEAFLEHGPAAVEMLERLTPMTFFWARGYSDYHPERIGGSSLGRTCESKPLNIAVLGRELDRLRPAVLEAPIPMPVTGADYKWLNLMLRTPLRSIPRVILRAVQGLGGVLLGRKYAAGGRALAAGLFAGLLRANVPVWTDTALTELRVINGRVRGAVLQRGEQEVVVYARRGVVLAAGGFDHNMAMRHEYQSSRLLPHVSLGAEGNTGDAIEAARALGAEVALMKEAWWFPAVAPVKDGRPSVLLAERSLPGSLMVDETGRRFINEATDYMSFGQEVLKRENAGRPIHTMWLVFDQIYRNRYLLAGSVFPRMPLPREWYQSGVAVSADSPGELAQKAGMPVEALEETLKRFNDYAAVGRDGEYGRGSSAYDRYYGDPTVSPNPNLRALTGRLHAVRVVLSDLGTCGGLRADENARVLHEDGSVIPGLYAIGNTAANAFGRRYPGAGATIGQGLVFGYIAARDMAARDMARQS